MEPVNPHSENDPGQQRDSESLGAELILRTESTMEQQLKFESFISELSVRFINLAPRELDGAIEDSQRLFCQVLGLDRSALYQYFDAEPGALLLTHLFESAETLVAGRILEKRFDPRLRSDIYWVAAEANQPGIYERVDLESFWPWVFKRLQRGEPIIVSKLEDLSKEAAQDREMFSRYGTKATVVMPMSSGGTKLGCLTFASLRGNWEWSEIELKRFRFIADVFANALARKRVEEALRQSETRFRHVAETVGDFIWEIDTEGLYTYTSPSVEKILGYAPEELVGKKRFYELFDPAVREQLREAAFSLFAQRRSFRNFPNRNIAKDGRIVHLETSGVPVLDEGGAVRGYRGSDADVTERLKVHEELRESEEKFRKLHESMRDAFVSVDLSGRIREFNSIYQQLLGYSEAELHAVSYRDITPDRWHALEERIIQEQVLTRGYSEVYEKEYQRKNGTIFPVELRTLLIRDDADRPVAMWAIVRDITERKRTEQALVESGERLREAAEATGFGAYVYDLARNQGSYSPELLALYGLPPEAQLETDEQRVPKAVHLEDKPAFMEAMHRANDPSGSGLLDMDFRIKRYDDGQLRWLRACGRTVFTGAGPERRAVRAHGITQDITERKLSEQALLRSYAEIKQLKDRLQVESDFLRAEIKSSQAHGQIIGRSPGLKRVLQQTEQVAPAACPVLISGETGTGKELIAQEIHKLSPRKNRMMVLVSCAALPSALVESELFGRERGAYTGALTSQLGRFEVANGSTIFLDEVGELSTDVQAKLLRVIQEGEFQRLGSPKTHKVDVRVIAATNRDLTEEVRKGRFREDLYYRLNVFPIYAPPLRQRAEDIPLLVFAFMEEFAARMGKRVTRISRKGMETLQAYSWPGNIRELRNVIEHSLILTSGDTLKLTGLGESPSTQAQPVTLAEAERQHILRTLDGTGWRIKGPHGAAARLALQPSTLYSRMQKLGIPHRRQRDEMGM